MDFGITCGESLGQPIAKAQRISLDPMDNKVPSIVGHWINRDPCCVAIGLLPPCPFPG